MLVKNGITLNTKEKFEKIKTKDKKYNRFVPNYLSGTKIKNFSCTCITPQNICSDYQGRPKLCRSYPFSIFLKDDKIPNTCGYYINIKTKVPKIKNKSISNKIDHIINNNDRCRILEEEL
ncbi:YkgJ family cysteine cluster protein [bacterium]|nr:YkgJ family cysteine cluster protein [bacterium]